MSAFGGRSGHRLGDGRCPLLTQSGHWPLGDKCDCGLTDAGRILRSPRRRIMKLVLIALGLLATTGVVYAACIFC